MFATPQTKPKKPNGRRERVGTVSNAGRSVASTAHKPDKAAPFLKHHRIDIDGIAVIISQRFEGFTALVPLGMGGLIDNPWTQKPFTNLKDCVKVTTYRMKKGYFPGMKKRSSTPITDALDGVRANHFRNAPDKVIGVGDLHADGR